MNRSPHPLSLSRIPIPAHRRWRFFCHEVLPWLVFAAALGFALASWPRVARASTLLAEAEKIEALLKPSQPGRLLSLHAEPFQSVKAGEILARVALAEPAFVAATLAKIRADIEFLRTTKLPILDTQRARLDRDRLRLDWLRERVTLAALRADLQQAEASLARLDPLHRQTLVTDGEHERARLQRDALRHRLVEQTRLVETLAPSFDSPSPSSAATPATADDAALRAAIAVQEETLRLTEAQLADQPLVAPFDGIVTLIHRRPGENLDRGEPVLTLVAPHSTHLIGFLRQPFRHTPRPGTPVEIRTRSHPRQSLSSEIVHVSTPLEPITPTLLASLNPAATTATIELGLRVHLSVPATLRLRPGEQVDVLIREDG